MRNRDKLIMQQEDTVINLVNKYKHHKQDEDDLYQIGMMKVIECVDDAIVENNFEHLPARCNIYARNGILKEVYSRKLHTIDNYYLYNLGKDDEMIEFYINEQIAGKTKTIFNMLVSGYTREEICEATNIKQSMFYVYRQQIRDIIVKNGE